MATVGTLSKTRLHAVGSPGRHPQLLPYQGTLRSGGSHQRQHQNSSSKGRGYKNLGYLLLKAQRMAVTKTEFIVLQKAA
jgi:hypothetical protein